METFFQKCLDNKLISRYICSDDKSSDADRDRMRREYPQMEFIYTNDGHAASLRQLFAAVDGDYMFHWEDDWEICNADYHITNLMDIMWSRPRIKSVIMSPYAPFWIKRPELRITAPAEEYYTGRGQKYFVIPDDGLLVDAWPGFSLNPAIHNVAAIHSVGDYPVTRLHEWTFADMYKRKGYMVAHVPEYLVNHFSIDTAYARETDR